MSRSLKVSPQYVAQVKQAVKRNGFPSQQALATELGLSLSTVKSFLNGRPVDYLNFVEIAEKLGQDWQEISQLNETNQPATIPDNFFAYDASWVGRDKLITQLSQNLRNSCRFLLILGLTILYGLDESEQEALFEIEGLDITQESEERPILLRLGKAYKGHPLVLRVIIGEINSNPFNGNVQAYWSDVNSKIEEVEKNLAEAEEGKTEGYDEWELHKLTRKVRDEVNRDRLKAVFNRLENQVRDAYILICAASVYRIPVQEEGWLMQLAALVRRVEKQDCSQERQEQALEELLNRFLAEESVNHNNKRVLGQHNLVRSVALESHRNLIRKLQGGEAA